MDNQFLKKPADAKLLDGFPEPRELPAWLTEQDIDVYASAYTRTGLGGILGFYRNIEADYHATKSACTRCPGNPFCSSVVPSSPPFASGASSR